MGDRVGQQFGSYRLVHLLGRGGFAEVYLGEHIHIQTQAAIKVLSTQLVAKDLERFIREARTIASLEHPHIVRVFDFGIQEEIPFLVMNYASNGTLRQRHPKESRVPLIEVLSYVQPIASALQYAHDRKIIHRDVKPENMLLGSQGEVLLSDFGIAVTTATSTSRETKTTAGTVAYMAPEQIMGRPSVASDQYALGVIVYEWLSGVQPFQGSFFEMCAQHLHAPVPSLRETNAEISLEVERCIAKALAKDPEKRFASIQDFATALQERSQLAISVLTSTPAQQLAPEKLSDSNTDLGNQTVVKAQMDTPLPFEIGQGYQTVVKTRTDAPLPAEMDQDDPTVLKPQPAMLIPSEIGQDDPTAIKSQQAVLPLSNDYLNAPTYIKPQQALPTPFATDQDQATLLKSDVNSMVHVAPEPSLITPPVPHPQGQVQRSDRRGSPTKMLMIMVASFVLLLLLVTTPLLFPFVNGILSVRTGNTTHLRATSTQRTAPKDGNNGGRCATAFIPALQSRSGLIPMAPTATATATPTPAPVPGTVTVSPQTVQAGNQVTVIGDSWPAMQELTIEITPNGRPDILGYTQNPADSTGHVALNFNIPVNTTPGTYEATIFVTSQPGLTQSTTFTISAPIPTPTPTPISISTPMTGSLTVEIAATLPNSATDGKTVQVNVNTSEPGVAVYLSVTYTYKTGASFTSQTQTQTTDGQGNATISWCVQAVPSGTVLPSGTIAQVQAIAQDQQGHQAKSNTVTVKISNN